ncbi:MAG TPA: Ohr family peroxiredoxin [Solirubrobacteraceae bacterium]|jgi:Ohr subfamily peroxiredoxin
MEVFYTTTGVSRGDGRSGSAALADGTLELEMSLPGQGDGANPEQLFALGYATCFHSALKFVAADAGTEVDGSTVSATVGIGRDGEAYGLEVRLQATVPGLGADEVQALLEAAHEVCPYSRATRGNIPVELTVG